VDEGDVVVARDDVPESGQPLLDALDRDSLGQRIAQVLEFLVRRRGRDEESVPVTWIPSSILHFSTIMKHAPAVRRPTMRVPPIEVCTIGTTSPSSASKAE
jgi:hypothetical protein